jgi:nucleoside-diphosphate-sugar epimerase
VSAPGTPRRALLTGATGFIGSHLLAHLQAAGWPVAVLARPSAAELLSQMPAIAKVYTYTGATTEVIAAMAEHKPEVVFHLSSHFLAAHDSTQIESLISSNVLFGTQLLEAMKAAGVTALVNAGTSWQNYAGDTYNPVNLYAATKQAFEDIVAYYTQTSGLRAVTLRLYDSYGEGDQRRKLLRLLLECLRTGEPMGMSPGDQVMDLVHVDDICRAFLHAAELALEMPAGASVYAVSSGERRTLKQVVATLEEAAGQKLAIEFGVRAHRPREVMVPWVGPPLPGWVPTISLLDGFKRLIRDRT